MANAATVLVLGASGNIGRHLVAELIAGDQRVKAATRDPARTAMLGAAEWVAFDYDDASTFDTALDGVDRVFLLCPSGHVDSNAKVSAFLDVAMSRVRKIVTLTAQGVNLDPAIPHHRMERRVASSGVVYVHLRPTWFADNFHTYWRNPIQRHSVIPVPAGNAKTAFIDARDIATCAARVLSTDSFDGETLILTGPDALDYTEAAHILSAALGRRVSYQPVHPDTFLANLMADGVPPDYAHMISSLFGLVVSGVTAEITDSVRAISGRQPLALADYAATYAHLLR